MELLCKLKIRLHLEILKNAFNLNLLKLRNILSQKYQIIFKYQYFLCEHLSKVITYIMNVTIINS